MQESIPYWHPLIVQLAVGVLVAAALAALIWMVHGASFWRRCCLFLAALGLAASVWAHFSGLSMLRRMEASPHLLLDVHRSHSELLLLVTSATVIALGAISFWLERRITIERDPADPILARLLVGLFLLASGLVAALAAYTGVAMVWS